MRTLEIHMPSNSLYRGSLLLLAAGLLPAAVNLSGPVAGYVADRSRPELRAITGVPGSYLFSDPLPLPDGSTGIHLAPGQDFAILERGDTGPALLFLSGGAVDHVADLPGAMPSADWAAFSSTSASALLYSAANSRLQLLTGLPSSPVLALDLDTSAFPEQPLNAALSDDGTLVLLASAHSLYRMPRDGPPQLLLSAGAIVSLAVLRNGADVAVADRTTASIQIVRNAATAPAADTLASGLSGIGRIYPSSDGAALFVARPGAKAVSSIDLATGAIQSVSSPTAPVALAPLRNRDTFLTSGPASARTPQPGTVFLLDSGAGRVVFIPAVKAEDAQ